MKKFLEYAGMVTILLCTHSAVALQKTIHIVAHNVPHGVKLTAQVWEVVEATSSSTGKPVVWHVLLAGKPLKSTGNTLDAIVHITKQAKQLQKNGFDSLARLNGYDIREQPGAKQTTRIKIVDINGKIQASEPVDLGNKKRVVVSIEKNKKRLKVS